MQGEAVGDLRHGRGTQTCSNGDTYRGAWRYDKREGTGLADFVRGAQYDGEWKDDKAHGCDFCELLCCEQRLPAWHGAAKVS